VPSVVEIATAGWPSWDGFTIGAQRSFWVKNKFPLKFTKFSDYTEALDYFVNSECEMGMLTIFEAILAADRGVKLKIILMLDYTVGSDGVIAHPNMGDKSEGKIVGATIGVEKHTIAHFTALKFLKIYGIKSSEIHFVHLPLAQLKDKFKKGELDFLSLYEPDMSECLELEGSKRVFSSREIPMAICDVLFVKQDCYEKRINSFWPLYRSWNTAVKQMSDLGNDFTNELAIKSGTTTTNLNKQLEGIFLTGINENQRAFGTIDHPGYLLDALQEMIMYMKSYGIIKNNLKAEELIGIEAMTSFGWDQK